MPKHDYEEAAVTEFLNQVTAATRGDDGKVVADVRAATLTFLASRLQPKKPSFDPLTTVTRIHAGNPTSFNISIGELLAAFQYYLLVEKNPEQMSAIFHLFWGMCDGMQIGAMN